MSKIKDWVKDILFACIVAALILTFIKPTIVKENSMQPTLYPNHYLLLSRQAYLVSEHKAGDIIVFNCELPEDDGAHKLLIKRIIALPGDSVTIAGGSVFINGELIEEPYIFEDETSGFVENLIVPEGTVFVMGDNRRVSRDSRSDLIGVISFDEIRGKAFFRLYPFNKIGLIK